MLTSPSVAQFRGTPVFLFVKDGSVPARMVDADLHDDLFRKSIEANTPRPQLLELEVCCPRCNEWNRIPGNKKRIVVYYFEKPRKLLHLHDGTVQLQQVMVTIEDELTCSHPLGKTVCGYTFRITENVIHRA